MERIQNSNLSEEEKKKAKALVAGGKILLASFDGVSDADVLEIMQAALELHAGFFQPRPQAEPGGDEVQSLSAKVAIACNIREADVHSHVVSRMVKRFGILVEIALRTNDDKLLAGAYEDALKLPSIETMAEMRENGFVMDGNLFSGNDNLHICFRNSVPHVLKILTAAEFERAKSFESILKEQGPCSWIISYELYSSPRHLKYFMFMPLYPITLEHLPVFDTAGTATLFWNCLSGALEFLHENGYAHNDIKPPNILINPQGEFILADLGSLVPFRQRSASTPAYLPRELWDRANNRGPIASPAVDYWMLAVTIFEKCGGEIGRIESPTQSEIIEAIKRDSKCNGFCADLLDHLSSNN